MKATLPIATIATVVLLGLAATVVTAQPAPPGTPLAAGLANPRGLSADGDAILVAELGSGQITRIGADGSTTVVASGLPTTVFFSAETGTDEVAGPSSAIAVPGGYVVTVSEGPEASMQSVYFVAEGSNSPTLMVDLGAYEQANNTDGDVDLAGNPELLSNPYEIIEYQDGFLVSNSGANAVLHIAADGSVTPFAIFPNRENPLFPGVGGPTMDQVPTGLTIGPDGAVYVGTLTGFPFPAGAARVYRLADLNDDGDALDEGETTVFVEGLTAVTDVAFDGNGDLLVTQFSTNMLAQAPGSVVRVSGGNIETVAGGLITPTALLVRDGRIIVSQEFATMVSDVTDVGDAAPASVPAPASTGMGEAADAGSRPVLPIALGLVAIVVVLGSRRLITQ